MRNRTRESSATRWHLVAGLAFITAIGGWHRLPSTALARRAQVDEAVRATQEGPALELRYSEPARRFEESILLGNGRIGASVFGGLDVEKIHLNDATLWSGRPVDPYMAPEAYRNLPAVRGALASKQWERADELVKALQGSFSQSFAPLGTLLLEMDAAGDATSYERSLDLRNAEASARYRIGTTDYLRRAFVSSPDSLLVLRLETSDPGALSFSIRFESLLRYRVRTEAGVLMAGGEAPVDAEPDYLGDVPDPIVYEDGHGTRFAVHVRIADTDGRVTGTGGTIRLTGASRATVLVSVATSFAGFDREPGLDGLDEHELAARRLAAAATHGFEDLRARHEADFRSFFDRVALDLGPDPVPDMTTDRRLLRYADGADDPYLEALYFQFGRYLLISSSRTPGVPANLQGIWNPHVRPPWSSNYTTNINLEMNYWPAEVTNLSEMHWPLLSFISNLAATGRVTAETFWGTEGWAVSHNSDIWAMSNPVGDFGEGQPMWANWNMAGVWLSTHLWEHYAFTLDREYLESYAYPLMVGGSRFVLDWLIENEDGYLVTAPSTSPENQYRTPEGYVGATLSGATADLAMIRELFGETLTAGEVLGIDDDLHAEVRSAMARLAPYRVGGDGTLQEWYEDWEDFDPLHRHQTHLFGLHPGSQLDPNRTPELAAAAAGALEVKGDESTGWSKAWRINLWARLWDGDRAYKLYRELLSYADPDAPINYENAGGTYPNLTDAHPPFQIDGNFGGTAGVAEMLLQSHDGSVRLHPALPSAWPEGCVRGLRARGGFEVDMAWAGGTLVEARVASTTGGTVDLVYGQQRESYDLPPNGELVVDARLNVLRRNPSGSPSAAGICR